MTDEERTRKAVGAIRAALTEFGVILKGERYGILANRALKAAYPELHGEHLTHWLAPRIEIDDDGYPEPGEVKP